ncbi:MAG: MarR family transcriptional regulator [Sneathiellales bacterium]|nr:MarR family transcriptional regulator [Sneathiellales bacterium]
MPNKDLIINSDMETDQKAVALIACIAQDYKVKMERLISPMDLSLLQLQILHALDYSPKGCLTVNQIKAAMVDDNSNVSRTLNKLVDMGMIVKERSSQDQRTVFIRITDLGRNAHKEADKLLLSHTTGLTEADVKKLYALLLKL